MRFSGSVCDLRGPLSVWPEAAMMRFLRRLFYFRQRRRISCGLAAAMWNQHAKRGIRLSAPCGPVLHGLFPLHSGSARALPMPALPIAPG